MSSALTITRGDDEVIRLALKDARESEAPVPADWVEDDPTTWGPLDLTGYLELWFYVKASAGATDADAVIRKTMGGGGISVTDPEGGLASVIIDAADTEGIIEPGLLDTNIHWEVQAKNPSGKVKTAGAGTFLISRDFVRATV